MAVPDKVSSHVIGYHLGVSGVHVHSYAPTLLKSKERSCSLLELLAARCEGHELDQSAAFFEEISNLTNRWSPRMLTATSQSEVDREIIYDIGNNAADRIQYAHQYDGWHGS